MSPLAVQAPEIPESSRQEWTHADTFAVFTKAGGKPELLKNATEQNRFATHCAKRLMAGDG